MGGGGRAVSAELREGEETMSFVVRLCVRLYVILGGGGGGGGIRGSGHTQLETRTCPAWLKNL